MTHHPPVNKAHRASIGSCLAVLALVLTLGLLGEPILLAQSEWQAGVAKTVITPQEKIWLAGYSSRERPVESVLQDLYAKALSLKDTSGAVSVMVTTDLLGFTQQMSNEVAARVEQQYGLPRDRLVINSSHTHSGPMTGDMLRPAYPMSNEHMIVVRRYTAGLLDQVVELVGKAISNLEPATLAFEQGLAGFAVNRRRDRDNRRHLPAPVDHDVPVITVRTANGSLLAIIFGYACHATVLSDYQINGDWPGWAQEALELKYPGAVALFVTGCGADANPLPRRSVELAKQYGDILATAVGQVLEGEMTPLTGPLSTAYERVDIPFRTPPTKGELESRLESETGSAKRHAEHLLKILDRDGRLPDRYPYPVQVWQFGKSLSMIHLAGEVVVDYSLRFKSEYGWDDTWVAGYSNEVFAYIPSLRILKEGDYEGGGAMIGYGQPGPFGPGVEEIIAEKVDDLMQQTQGAE